MTTNLCDPINAALARFFAGRALGGTQGCVALSGGLDSVVLLHALSCWRSAGGSAFGMTALHVHHGLSPNADTWAGFCADLCRENAVALEVVRVHVPRDSGEGLEAAARRLRHRAFADSGADWLALAQHRDDQAETVLLHLMRGAGVAGAAGMPAERQLPGGPALVRPLLDVPRVALEGYAVAHGLRWIEDESNSDRHFRRNFLRHDILPVLEDKFPGARRSLARAATHFAEASSLLDELAALDEAEVCQPSGRIGLKAFNTLAPARARNLLRRVWTNAGFRAPDARWIDEARRQLAATDPGSETCVATPEGALHVYRGELYFVARQAALPAGPLPWSGEAELAWGDGVLRFESCIGRGIRRELLAAGPVLLCARRGGERLKLHAVRPRRALRNLLQEAAIPPWERERLPFLWVGDRLVWVAKLGVDADWACLPGEEGVLPVWPA